jgi:hypothetical protein
MVKNYLFLVVILFAIACNNTTPVKQETVAPTAAKIPTLKPLWQTDTTSLKTPEAVIYDDNTKLLYVSCIGGTPPDKKDNDGYIAQVGLDGKIVNAKWVTGLHAPKGLGIKGDMLYVTDVDALVVIQISTGKIMQRVAVPGSKFLNDVDVAADGTVYFSDSGNSSIHRYNGSKVELFVQDTAALKGPNGVLCQGDELHMVNFGNSLYHTAAMKSPVLQLKADSLGQGDGLERYKNGGYFVSSWNGEVRYVDTNWKRHLLLDTKAEKRSAADIDYIAEKNLLLVPEFFANRVSAYNVE